MAYYESAVQKSKQTFEKQLDASLVNETEACDVSIRFH